MTARKLLHNFKYIAEKYMTHNKIYKAIHNKQCKKVNHNNKGGGGSSYAEKSFRMVNVTVFTCLKIIVFTSLLRLSEPNRTISIERLVIRINGCKN